MNSRLIKQLVAATLLLVGLSACNTYAQFQEADTLPQGTFRGGFGGSFGVVPGSDWGFNPHNEDRGTPATGPAFHGFLRYGVADRREFHAQVASSGGSIGGKYQFVGGPSERGFAFSLGADFGYFVDALTRHQGPSFAVPFFLGWRFADWAQLQLTPKYVLQTQFGIDEGGLIDVIARDEHLVGGSIGTTLGKSIRFHGELSLMYAVELDAVIIAPSFGISFGP